MTQLALMLLALSGPAQAESCRVYQVWTTSSLTLRLTAAAETTEKAEVLFWSKAGRWEAAAVERNGRRVTCKLDVESIADGRTTLLIGRPANVDINDRQPPALSAAIDGRPLPADGTALYCTTCPTRLECTVTDQANAIDPQGMQVRLNGQAITTTVTTTAKGLVARAALPALDFGAHRVAVQARDVSPFGNRGEQTFAFSYTVGADLALAKAGVTVRVDSCYPDYTAGPLIDGDWQSGATSGSPQVTWACAETEQDHWIELTWPKPRVLGAVSLFWVRKGVSAEVRAQVPKAGGWDTVATARPQTRRSATTLRLPNRPIDRLRILQPKGAGLPDRPHLMWVGEVVVTAP